MVPLINNEQNILIIVEGAKLEKSFFSQIFSLFDKKYQVYCFGTNIYSLYKSMKEIDFNGDIKDVLLNSKTNFNKEQKAILSKNFVYTYLVFDFDAHHSKLDEDRSIDEIVCDNLKKLKEMSSYFTNETDPTIGKLYINYPMMESFRDCNDFFDDDYANAEIELKQIVNYKNIVSNKKLNRFHINDLSKENYEMLTLQNLYKLNLLYYKRWQKPSYDEYLKISSGNAILEKEIEVANKKSKIKVLNTSLFVMVDYFGNKNNYYDSLIKKK